MPHFWTKFKVTRAVAQSVARTKLNHGFVSSITEVVYIVLVNNTSQLLILEFFDELLLLLKDRLNIERSNSFASYKAASSIGGL